MQTWTDEALRALLCEELEAASYPVRRKQLIERSARGSVSGWRAGRICGPVRPWCAGRAGSGCC